MAVRPAQSGSFTTFQHPGTLSTDATSTLKDVFWAVTRTHGQATLAEGNTFQLVTMEEVHHALHRGLAGLHPPVFGTESGDTELMVAYAQARGNCEIANECAMSGCTTYACQCDSECEDIHAWGCSFIAGSCDGAYHYADTGCGATCAGGSELFYWGWTSHYGWQEQQGNCESIAQEWEACTPEQLATSPPAR